MEEGGEGGEGDAQEAEGRGEEQGGEFLRGGDGCLAEDFGAAAAQEVVEKVVTEAQTVKKRLGETEIIVFEGQIGRAFHDKAMRCKQGAEGGNGEMVEMARDVEVKPFVAGEARLGAAEVRDSAQKNSAGAQQARDLSEGVLRIAHVFEDVPHDNGIEAAILKLEGSDIADRYRKLQHISRVGGGLRTEFGAMHFPFTVSEFPEQKSGAAPDVEDTAFAREHSFDCHRSSPVKRSLEAFDGCRKASCPTTVVFRRIIFGQLVGGGLRARKGNGAITTAFDEERVAGNVIARGEKTLLRPAGMKAGRRHLAWHYDCSVVI